MFAFQQMTTILSVFEYLTIICVTNENRNVELSFWSAHWNTLDSRIDQTHTPTTLVRFTLPFLIFDWMMRTMIAADLIAPSKYLTALELQHPFFITNTGQFHMCANMFCINNHENSPNCLHFFCVLFLC